MAVINRIAAFAEDMTAWRRHLHSIPEIKFDCHETSAFVVSKLREFGVNEIHEGIAETGIVAIIEGQKPGKTIGLRADMDALPMSEATDLSYASSRAGAMHACGHDGHTTMLLGAARYLQETRNFAGRVALIFQPAEEDGGGAGVMVKEGILERFDIEEIYALHNSPGTPIGHFHTTPGPIMAAVDTFTVIVTGRGGHGAYPQDCIDPIVAAASIVQALQTIVSRNHDGRQDLVLSVTQFHAGTADNIIPENAFLNGTIRTFDPAVQNMVHQRLRDIVAGNAASFGVTADVEIEIGYPSTVNDAACTALAANVARSVVGADAVQDQESPEMGAEDFSYFLNERPGAYLFIGNGETAGLHHPKYDFSDEASPTGASFFARLVEEVLPLKSGQQHG